MFRNSFNQKHHQLIKDMKNENVLDCLFDLLAILTYFYWNNLSGIHSPNFPQFTAHKTKNCKLSPCIALVNIQLPECKI